jgi:hypothetical protein
MWRRWKASFEKEYLEKLEMKIENKLPYSEL